MNTADHSGQNQRFTASPRDVLLARYDAAIRFTEQTRQAIVDNDRQAKSETVGHVLTVLGELVSTLDHRRAPELCANLELLYNYMSDRLHQASAAMDLGAVDEVRHHLRHLRDSWAEVIRQATERA